MLYVVALSRKRTKPWNLSQPAYGVKGEVMHPLRIVAEQQGAQDGFVHEDKGRVQGIDN